MWCMPADPARRSETVMAVSTVALGMSSLADRCVTSTPDDTRSDRAELKRAKLLKDILPPSVTSILDGTLAAKLARVLAGSDAGPLAVAGAGKPVDMYAAR
jgi:hypothetical protein